MNNLSKPVTILRTSLLMLLVSVVILITAGCDTPSEPGASIPPPTAEAQSNQDVAPTLPPEPGNAVEEPQPENTAPVPPPPSDNQLFLPHISTSGDETQPPSDAASGTMETGPQLAFLRGGNLWLANISGGAPVQITQSGDLFSYAWAPDGESLATFNGHSLCFVQRDGSVTQACMDLSLDDMQALVPRQMVWSPNRQYIVLWNPVNPWDEGAIGWLIVAVDGSGTTWRIEDPVDWGLSMAPNNEPGGITGQPIFLADGTLLGTLTHRWVCNAGGCHYQLYQFDFNQGSFTPYPNKAEEGWSEGQNLALSGDQSQLANYGTFDSGCEVYTTFVDLYKLQNQSRQIFNLEQEALTGMALSPDGSQAIIARGSRCSSENQGTWASACGLTLGFDVYAMQLWNLAANQRNDLLPGLFPTWSPDGNWIAFQSCLAQENGQWVASSSSPPSTYILAADGTVTLIAEGTNPTWLP